MASVKMYTETGCSYNSCKQKKTFLNLCYFDFSTCFSFEYVGIKCMHVLVVIVAAQRHI